MSATRPLRAFTAPRSLAALLLILFGGTAACAEEPEHASFQRSAFVGRPITLDSYADTNEDCSNAGYADVRVRSGGAMGARPGSVQVTRDRAFPAFDEESGRQHCNRRRVPSVTLRYTPTRPGRDTVRVDIVWHDGINWTRTYDIHVR